MSEKFDRATRLTACGDGVYEREVSKADYWGMVTPHGGYVMSLMMAAMQSEVSDATHKPRSMTQHFLGKIAPGKIRVEVTVERASRSVTSVSARMRSGETVTGYASALLTADRAGPVFLDDKMPEVAKPSPESETPPTFGAPVHQEFSFYRRFGSDGPVVPVEDGGWVRPHETGPWDHRFALLLSDAWIPPIIRHPDRTYATPSLHQVVHFGDDVQGDGSEDFLIRHTLSNAGGGVTDESIKLWTDDGRLMMQARQQRMVVNPQSIIPPDLGA